MSLDVSLRLPGAKVNHGPQIFVRKNGKGAVAISREEWDELCEERGTPGVEPATFDAEETDVVYHDNITHNLTEMAERCGLYKPLWHPEELGVAKARDLCKHLQPGIAALGSDPGKYKKFNPDNGWGTY